MKLKNYRFENKKNKKFESVNINKYLKTNSKFRYFTIQYLLYVRAIFIKVSVLK